MAAVAVLVLDAICIQLGFPARTVLQSVVRVATEVALATLVAAASGAVRLGVKGVLAQPAQVGRAYTYERIAQKRHSSPVGVATRVTIAVDLR